MEDCSSAIWFLISLPESIPPARGPSSGGACAAAAAPAPAVTALAWRSASVIKSGGSGPLPAPAPARVARRPPSCDCNAVFSSPSFKAATAATDSLIALVMRTIGTLGSPIVSAIEARSFLKAATDAFAAVVSS